MFQCCAASTRPVPAASALRCVPGEGERPSLGTGAAGSSPCSWNIWGPATTRAAGETIGTTAVYGRDSIPHAVSDLPVARLFKGGFSPSRRAESRMAEVASGQRPGAWGPGEQRADPHADGGRVHARSRLLATTPRLRTGAV